MGQYYAGIGMAHARYSEFLDSASSAVMPRKTPAYESIYSGASAKIAGTPTHRFQAALNTASAHYAEAVEAASSKSFASINSVISEKLELGSSSVSSAVYGT